MQNTCRKMWLWSVSGPDFLHWQLEFLNISGRWFLCRLWIQLKSDVSCPGSLFGSGFHFPKTRGGVSDSKLFPLGGDWWIYGCPNSDPSCTPGCVSVCVYKTWLLQHVVGAGLSSAMSGPHNEWHSSHGHTSARQWVGQWWARSTPQRCHSFHSGNGSRSKPEEPEGMKVQRFKSVWQWTVTEREELHLTWAIIPIKAHSLNIFRGTLTRYWRINTKHLIEHFLKHISNSSNNLKLLTCLFEFYDTSWQQ